MTTNQSPAEDSLDRRRFMTGVAAVVRAAILAQVPVGRAQTEPRPAVYGPDYGPMIKFNPHIRFFDGDRRGYLRCQVDRSRLRADLQVVTTVSRPDAPESTFASFVVEHGRPGAHRSS
jgi:phosphodiesterase/alkaline phosphatase D-like protein